MSGTIIKSGILSAFMASSIREFSRERAFLSAVTAEYNGAEGKPYTVLEKCEHIYDNMSAGGKQGEYDEFIRSADIFILLAGKYLGRYTIGEIDIAIENNVRIFVLKESPELSEKYGFDPASPDNAGCGLTDEVIRERSTSIPDGTVFTFCNDDELRTAFENILHTAEKEQLFAHSELTLAPYRTGIAAQTSLSFEFGCALADSISRGNDARVKNAAKEGSMSLFILPTLLKNADNNDLFKELLEFDAVFFIITHHTDRSMSALSTLYSSHKMLMDNKYISSYVYRNSEGCGEIQEKMNEFAHYTSFFTTAAELYEIIGGKILDDVKAVLPEYRAAVEGFAEKRYADIFFDLEKTWKYFSYAAYMLGMVCRERSMPDKARECFIKAALCGQREAAALAGRYFYGTDIEKSIMFYSLAAESGSAEAMLRLAEIYRADGEKDRAFEYYTEAADRGDPNGAYGAYSLMKETGDKRAGEYYRKYIALSRDKQDGGKAVSSEDGEIIGGHYRKINSSEKICTKKYTIYEAKDINGSGELCCIKQFTMESKKNISKEISLHRSIHKNLQGSFASIPRVIEDNEEQGYIVYEYTGSRNILKWWDDSTAAYRRAKQEYVQSIDSDMDTELKKVIKQTCEKQKKIFRRQINSLITGLRPLLNDVASLHDNGILHCGICCESIMVTEENDIPRFHLADLGMARKIDDDMATGDLINRREKCFPKISSKDSVSPSYDIYSLCAVIFRLITGSYPSECIDSIEQTRRLKEECTPDRLCRILIKGLSKGEVCFDAVGYENCINGSHQKNSLIYRLYYKGGMLSVGKIERIAAIVILIFSFAFIAIVVTSEYIIPAADSSVLSLSRENILRSDYKWKDKCFYNALVEAEGWDPDSEALLSESCKKIRTLVINNGKISMLSTDEAFSNGFANDVYSSEYFGYKEADAFYKNNITSVEDIPEIFPNLTTLAIYNCPLAAEDEKGSEYSALSRLTELQYLKIDNCGYTNMSIFGGGNFPKLKWLELNDNGVLADMSAAAELPSLFELRAENNEYVNISGLENSGSLSTLNLANSETEPEKLSALTNIGFLYLTDISPEAAKHISHLSGLKKLCIINSDFTGNTELLGDLGEQLTELTLLDISQCIFDSFDALAKQLGRFNDPDVYMYSVSYSDGSATDAKKLYLLDNVKGISDYKWKDNGLGELYEKTEGTDKVDFSARKTYDGAVSPVLLPSGISSYNEDITANSDTVKLYANSYDHINADTDAPIALDDITELYPNIEVLAIKDVIIKDGDLSPLKKLTGLRRLTLENCGVTSAAFFGEMKDSAITEVRFADLGRISDLDALEALPNLEDITLAQLDFDMDELCRLTDLRRIEIYDYPDHLPQEYCKRFSEFTKLTSLDLNRNRVNNEEELIDDILMCRQLKSLQLGYGTVSEMESLERLSDLPCLEKLYVMGYIFSDEELEKLSFCPQVIHQ